MSKRRTTRRQKSPSPLREDGGLAEGIVINPIVKIKAFEPGVMDFDAWTCRMQIVLQGLSEEQKLSQLELGLGDSALKTFRLLPEEDRKDLKTALGALRPYYVVRTPTQVARTALFTCKQLPGESVREFVRKIRQLGKEAFPEEEIEDLQVRILNGCIISGLRSQALRQHLRINPPKGLSDILVVSDILQEEEGCGTATYSEGSTKPSSSDGACGVTERLRHGQPPGQPAQRVTERLRQGQPPGQPAQRLCWVCGKPGHIAKNCAQRVKPSKHLN